MANKRNAMIHAIRKSGRTSNAHGWHPCSIAAQHCVLFACYNVPQIGGRFNAANVLLYADFLTLNLNKMKVFVAEKREKGNISPTDYHWCDDNDLLMFGQFQLGNGNPSEVAMCGIQSRKFTTHILVKDMNIDTDFYKELLTESVEKAMGCEIDRNGNYEIEMGFSHHFNINDIMNELLEKASHFKDGQKVKCFGRTLTAVDG